MFAKIAEYFKIGYRQWQIFEHYFQGAGQFTIKAADATTNINVDANGFFWIKNPPTYLYAFATTKRDRHWKSPGLR